MTAQRRGEVLSGAAGDQPGRGEAGVVGEADAGDGDGQLPGAVAGDGHLRGAVGGALAGVVRLRGWGRGEGDQQKGEGRGRGPGSEASPRPHGEGDHADDDHRGGADGGPGDGGGWDAADPGPVSVTAWVGTGVTV
ncbi:hypothetical protein [Microbacterium sp. SCN 70-200]|uniref:hypothetical protein n=1 Tax=Microbacterium sp. SCN 70-200 TaxID=1660113 RepID=UPI0025E53658|nr:hypothetical protein [Microbacterium sp. SCN 70-200]